MLLSMPCLLLGVLGLIGVVADVGVAENRSIGFGFLRLAIIPLSVGGVVLVIGLLARRGRTSHLSTAVQDSEGSGSEPGRERATPTAHAHRQRRNPGG